MGDGSRGGELLDDVCDDEVWFDLGPEEMGEGFGGDADNNVGD